MSAAKHTPGPWEVKPEEVGRPYIRIRGTALGSRFKVANALMPDASTLSDKLMEMEQAQTRANANLIAAAPELLEACLALTGWVKAGHHFIYPPGSLQQITAAIAKATGSAA